MKKTITLEAIDPIEIYGAGNRILEALCNYYPDTTIIARGNEIRVDGDEKSIEDFEMKINTLIEKRKHKMNLTPYDVEEMFEGESPAGITGNVAMRPFLVFGALMLEIMFPREFTTGT